MTDEGNGTPVGSTAEPAGGQSGAGAARLNLSSGQVVQEFGYDDDVDQDLRLGIEEITGSEMVDEDYDDVTDVVVIWWREDDGDLTDALVDARTVLDEGGSIWLLTLKPGRAGTVGHSDIEEAATTAGLHATSTLTIAADWSATRLGTRGRGR
ncbi:DUF3052 domain-containing protein [Actinotalea sp. BY-33]|uniref:DUF3052 domain-containing protein n=1 Tax=Actinotalea soli TaxID=2819234 RepID=A0A939LQC9_9CELL|nr:DUF3052 domain-containing protein [Actinotalea soli]